MAYLETQARLRRTPASWRSQLPAGPCKSWQGKRGRAIAEMVPLEFPSITVHELLLHQKSECLRSDSSLKDAADARAWVAMRHAPCSPDCSSISGAVSARADEPTLPPIMPPTCKRSLPSARWWQTLNIHCKGHAASQLPEIVINKRTEISVLHLTGLASQLHS
jgi:hypothetical protein